MQQLTVAMCVIPVGKPGGNVSGSCWAELAPDAPFRTAADEQPAGNTATQHIFNNAHPWRAAALDEQPCGNNVASFSLPFCVTHFLMLQQVQYMKFSVKMWPAGTPSCFSVLSKLSMKGCGPHMYTMRSCMPGTCSSKGSSELEVMHGLI